MGFIPIVAVYFAHFDIGIFPMVISGGNSEEREPPRRRERQGRNMWIVNDGMGIIRWLIGIQ
jgi:hypothetical protein